MIELGWILFALSMVLVGWVVRRSQNDQTQVKLLSRENDRLTHENSKLENEKTQLQQEGTTLKEQMAALRVQVDEAEKRIRENKITLDEARHKMEQSFKALASETLKAQSESFLNLATERLDKKTIEAKGVLEEKTILFSKLVEPIEKTLGLVQKEIGEFEKKRAEQFGQISEQLKHVVESSEGLQKEAKSLSTALRRPEVRGSWGELQLKRVVELAGMSSYCDFEEQVHVEAEKSSLRPDMVVRLPNQRTIVVDSKAVLNAYIDSLETEDFELKKELLAKHAKNVRNRIKELSKKSYWEQFEKSPDFVILFIPNESFLDSAVQEDRSLIEDGWKDKVIVATPTTLIALLKAVAYGWQQNELAENAKQVIVAAQELYDRLHPWLEHLRQVGHKLEDSVESFNAAVGSLESRVLPSARKMKNLGLSGLDAVVAPSSIEVRTRKPKALLEGVTETVAEQVEPKFDPT